jgi:hypothetical protein
LSEVGGFDLRLCIVPAEARAALYSTRVQQRHRPQATSPDCDWSLTCPRDRKRPRCREFASGGVNLLLASTGDGVRLHYLTVSRKAIETPQHSLSTPVSDSFSTPHYNAAVIADPEWEHSPHQAIESSGSSPGSEVKEPVKLISPAAHCLKYASKGPLTANASSLWPEESRNLITT